MSKAPVTKADLIESLKDATQRESCTRWALSLTLTEKPECVTHLRISKEESYEYRLYGSRYSHGGIVLRIFRFKGQNDSIESHFLTDLCSYAVETSVAGGVLIKLKQAQREAIAKHGWYDPGSKQRSVPKLKATP